MKIDNLLSQLWSHSGFIQPKIQTVDDDVGLLVSRDRA